MASQFLSLTQVVLTSEFMFNSSMGIEGTFWYYGAITFIGTLFVGIFIKETKGLSN